MHGIFHFIFGGLSALFFNLPILPAMFGALVPDIDIHFSTLGKYVGFTKFGHRTIVHSWIPVTILLLLSYFSQNVYIISFTIGWISHLILDLFDKQGIAFFWPKKTFFSIRTIK